MYALIMWTCNIKQVLFCGIDGCLHCTGKSVLSLWCFLPQNYFCHSRRIANNNNILAKCQECSDSWNIFNAKKIMNKCFYSRIILPRIRLLQLGDLVFSFFGAFNHQFRESQFRDVDMDGLLLMNTIALCAVYCFLIYNLQQ